MELTGRTINGFQIGKPLGQGGMGIVYEARELATSRPVAFKILHQGQSLGADEQEAVLRLRDEALATSKVKCRGLIELIGSGEISELGPYVVYEFIAGGTLQDYVKEKGPQELSKVLKELAEPLLEGLAALHQASIVHRDVKPANIFRREDGTFVLGDMGLAYFEGRDAKTKTGLIVGTPGYLAPECLLAAGSKPTPATDCYAAAMVICKALTGKSPIVGISPHEKVMSQIKGSVSAARLRALGLAPLVAKTLSEALHLDPKQRTNDALQLLKSLRQCLRTSKSELRATAQVSVQRPLIKSEKSKAPKSKGWLLSLLPLFVMAVLSVFSFTGPRQVQLKKEDVKVETGANSIFAKWSAKAPEDRQQVTLVNKEGRTVFVGQSSYDEKSGHHIRVARLQPKSTYQLNIGPLAVKGVKTQPLQLTRFFWIDFDGTNLFTDGSTNGMDQTLKLFIESEGQVEKELAWKGKSQIFDNVVRQGASKLSWRLTGNGDLLQKGVLFKEKTRKTELLWNSHRVSCLKWYDHFLVLSQLRKGFAYTVADYEAKDRHRFWKPHLMYGKSEDHFPHRLLYRKSKDEILSFSFDEVQSCWFAKVSLKGGPRVIQERRLMKLSNNFRPDGEPIKVGQRLLFLGSTPGQICWLTFDLVKEEFDEILLVSRNGLLPKGRGKKSKFLVATGFKLRRNRIHGCPILSNDSVYSILTLSDDDGQGLVSVLLCRKVDADSGIIKGELKALGHCAVMASDQLPPADSKGRFVLAGTNTIWRYDGKSFNKGPLLQNPLAYLGSSVIFYRGRGYCFAFIVHNKGMDELAQAFKTVSVHLASFGEDRKVTIHEPRIAYSQIMQGENLFCARHLTLWKERYLVASMMGHCFAICLKSGAYRVIRHNDRVVSLALATNGTVAAYLDSSRIWSTQVELFLRNAKRLRLRN